MCFSVELNFYPDTFPQSLIPPTRLMFSCVLQAVAHLPHPADELPRHFQKHFLADSGAIVLYFFMLARGAPPPHADMIPVSFHKPSL